MGSLLLVPGVALSAARALRRCDHLFSHDEDVLAGHGKLYARWRSLRVGLRGC